MKVIHAKKQSNRTRKNILRGSEFRSCAGSEINEAEAVKSRNFSAAINQ